MSLSIWQVSASDNWNHRNIYMEMALDKNAADLVHWVSATNSLSWEFNSQVEQQVDQLYIICMVPFVHKMQVKVLQVKQHQQVFRKY